MSKTTAKKATARSGATQTTDEIQSALLDLFIEELKDIYWAEKHLVKSLPKMQKAASSEELQDAIETHLDQTEGHVEKLEQIFELLERKPQAKKCDGMEALIKEGQDMISETEDGTATRDVAIILSAQKVEHYEIATYGSLAQLANTLGLRDAADILEEILAEEKETDVLLSSIAENSINYEASQEEES